MNIVVISDSKYAMQTGVLLQSFFNHNSGHKNTVYILTNKFHNTDKEHLKNICDKHGAEMELVEFREEPLLPFAHMGIWSKYTFIKVLIPQLLPPFVEKVIYLDSDMLVLDSLKEVYDVDLNDSIAGVEDLPVMSAGINRCGLDTKTIYINSGFMIINLVKWRKEDANNSFLNLLKTKETHCINDQDLINSVFAKKVMKLSPRYNVTNLFFGIKNPLLPTYKAEWIEGRKHPVIIHFVCGRKSWIPEVSHPYKIMDKYPTPNTLC